METVRNTSQINPYEASCGKPFGGIESALAGLPIGVVANEFSNLAEHLSCGEENRPALDRMEAAMKKLLFTLARELMELAR